MDRCCAFWRRSLLNVRKSLPLFLVVLSAVCGMRANAQSATKPDPLFTTIKSLDAKLFDAYNQCDLTTLGAMVSDDLEVYPLKGFGAVEIGIHRFHHPGHPEYDVGDAKFIMLWQNKDGAWQVTRVISYDHNHGPLAK